MVFVGSSLVLSIIGLDFMSSVSASATTPGNVGPGLSSQIGPMSNFASLHAIGKVVLILSMWIGRREVTIVLVLFVPSFWKN
jgi:trk system potassium uptake protein TrkH